MKVLKNLFNVVFSLEVIIVILILLLNWGPYFIEMKPFAVLSGSMEPSILTGSMAYVKTDVKSDDIKVGDIIAFNINEDKYVTHRVIEVNKEEKNFITKGDANKVSDFSPVPFDSVIGTTEFSIPYFGTFMQWLTSLQGKIILFGLLICNVLISYLFNEEEEKGNEKIE